MSGTKSAPPAMTKLLRTIRLDASDTFVYERAAAPAEWAVAGGFMFWDRDPATLTGRDRQAFRAGFLGLTSFGWSTLAVVVEATADEREEAVAHLSRSSSGRAWRAECGGGTSGGRGRNRLCRTTGISIPRRRWLRCIGRCATTAPFPSSSAPFTPPTRARAARCRAAPALSPSSRRRRPQASVPSPATRSILPRSLTNGLETAKS